MNYGEYFDKWLETYKKRAVKNSTFKNYQENSKHLQPLRSVEIDKLTAFDCQSVINSMVDSNLSTSTIKHTLTLLRQSLEKAVQLGYCLQNPCYHIELPRQARQRVTALSEFEITQLFKYGTNDIYFYAFKFLLYSGLRVGELFALEHEDIDRESGTININKSYYRGELTTTKTDTSSRIIPLTPELDKIIRQNQTKKGLVFRSTKGGYINYGSFLKSWHRLQEKCNLKNRYGLHVLRHTYATALLRGGADVKSIAALLGHSSCQITLDVYCDVDIGQLAENAAKLNFAL